MALEAHIDPVPSSMAVDVVDAQRPVAQCERPECAGAGKRAADHEAAGTADRERRP